MKSDTVRFKLGDFAVDPQWGCFVGLDPCHPPPFCKVPHVNELH